MKNISNQYVQSYTYNVLSGNVDREYINKRLTYIRPNLKNVKKILELGCGDGLLAVEVKKESGCEVYGLDISRSGIALAKERGIHAQLADLNEDLPYKDATFDIIFSDQLLEHIFRTDHLLDEMYRVLKPNGVVITVTPNLSFWLNRILFLFGFYPMFLEVSENTKIYGLKSLKRFIIDKNSMGHIRVFNLEALKDIFQNHGFRLKMIHGDSLSWNLPSPFKQFYDLLDRFFSLFPSLSRDLIIEVNKPKRGR